jgi:hypothetical protein
MKRMRPAFVKALSVGMVSALIGSLAVAALDAGDAWFVAVALVSGFLASLADPVGFYGEPHPFARRSHR